MFLGIVFKFSSYCSCMLYLTSNVLFLIFNMLHYHLKSLQHAVSCVWNTFPPLLQLANFTRLQGPIPIPLALYSLPWPSVFIQLEWPRSFFCAPPNTLLVASSRQVIVCCHFCTQIYRLQQPRISVTTGASTLQAELIASTRWSHRINE